MGRQGGEVGQHGRASASKLLAATTGRATPAASGESAPSGMSPRSSCLSQRILECPMKADAGVPSSHACWRGPVLARRRRSSTAEACASADTMCHESPRRLSPGPVASASHRRVHIESRDQECALQGVLKHTPRCGRPSLEGKGPARRVCGTGWHQGRLKTTPGRAGGQACGSADPRRNEAGGACNRASLPAPPRRSCACTLWCRNSATAAL